MTAIFQHGSPVKTYRLMQFFMLFQMVYKSVRLKKIYSRKKSSFSCLLKNNSGTGQKTSFFNPHLKTIPIKSDH